MLIFPLPVQEKQCLNIVSLLLFPHQIFASVNRKRVIHKNSLQQMSVPTSDNENFAMKTSREKGMMKQDSSASGRWKVSLPIYWWCNSWAPISLTHALRIHVFATINHFVSHWESRKAHRSCFMYRNKIPPWNKLHRKGWIKHNFKLKLAEIH